MNKRQINRQKWVDDYNNSLPQEIYYDSDGEENTIGIGGIHCSEYMSYVFDNVDIYGRIKKIKRQLKKKHDIRVTMVTDIMCRKCVVWLEPHTMEEHLDINHCVHSCEGGHKRS